MSEREASPEYAAASKDLEKKILGLLNDIIEKNDAAIIWRMPGLVTKELEGRGYTKMPENITPEAIKKSYWLCDAFHYAVGSTPDAQFSRSAFLDFPGDDSVVALLEKYRDEGLPLE